MLRSFTKRIGGLKQSLPLLHILDGLLGGGVVVRLHGAIHVGELHLATEVHVHGGALDGGAGQVLHGVPQAGVVDAAQLGLGPLQHEEGGQVGGVRGNDDHSKSGPDHAQHPGGEAPGRALADPAVQQDSPGEPHRGAEIEGLLLVAVRVRELEASERRESEFGNLELKRVVNRIRICRPLQAGISWSGCHSTVQCSSPLLRYTFAWVGFCGMVGVWDGMGW